MRCHEVRHNLDLFIRQGLTPSIRKKIEIHLSGCGTCREELARLRRLEELLASCPSPPVPEGFAQSVVERASREAVPCDVEVFARRPVRVGLGRRARIAAGTAAALAGGLLLGSYLGTQTCERVPRAAVERAHPLDSSGLGQLVEPGGDSLAQAYLALTSGGDGY